MIILPLLSVMDSPPRRGGEYLFPIMTSGRWRHLKFLSPKILVPRDVVALRIPCAGPKHLEPIGCRSIRSLDEGLANLQVIVAVLINAISVSDWFIETFKTEDEKRNPFHCEMRVGGGPIVEVMFEFHFKSIARCPIGLNDAVVHRFSSGIVPGP